MCECAYEGERGTRERESGRWDGGRKEGGGHRETEREKREGGREGEGESERVTFQLKGEIHTMAVNLEEIEQKEPPRSGCHARRHPGPRAAGLHLGEKPHLNHHGSPHPMVAAAGPL